MRTAVFLCALVLLTAAAAVRADMVVELEDGRRFVLPVDRHEVRRIRFSDGTELSGGRIRLLEGAEPEAPQAAPAPTPGARVLRVSPDGPFFRPSEAAAAARDGDVVEIAAGRYVDVAVWRASDLVIRGVGGRPVIDAGGRGAEGKAVWVIRGERVRIEDVELTGSAVADRNGAGIRAEGADLELVRTSIHHNEMGVLVAASFRGTLAVRESEIFANGTDHERYGVPPGHQIYASGGDLLLVEGSWIHGLAGGHGIKSRARRNEIRCSRIEDGEGAGSYLVDIAEAAPTLIAGSVLVQGERAENRTLVSFGAEGGDPDARLTLAFSTLETRIPRAVFVANRTPTPAYVASTVTVGDGLPADGPVRMAATFAFASAEAGGLDPRTLVPRPSSPVVDAAADPGLRGMVPACSPGERAGSVPRRVAGAAPDAGAFEAR